MCSFFIVCWLRMNSERWLCFIYLFRCCDLTFCVCIRLMCVSLQCCVNACLHVCASPGVCMAADKEASGPTGQYPPEESFICQWCHVMSLAWLADIIPAWVFCMCKDYVHYFPHVCVPKNSVIQYSVLHTYWPVHPNRLLSAWPLCWLLTHGLTGNMPTTTPIVPTQERMKGLSLSNTHTTRTYTHLSVKPQGKSHIITL